MTTTARDLAIPSGDAADPALPTSVGPASAAAQVEHWLRRFDSALRTRDRGRLAELFAPESYLRDLLALTWKIGTVAEPTPIAEALLGAADRAGFGDLGLAAGSTAPSVKQRVGQPTIEAFVTFSTAHGPGRGVLRLVAGDDGESRAWVLSTVLDQLNGWEERVGPRRPTGHEYSRGFGGPNWLDHRVAQARYGDRDPAVLVVGAGQAGLAIGARLGRMGIDTLLIDRHERVGDVWRKRYHSLTLHNQTWVAHLPYMPFPESWPVYVPKDMLANWFEAYADAMELNVWTSSELASASYDEGRWTATVRRRDGTEAVLHPRHIVMATGVSGLAQLPDLAGLDEFRGPVVHSSEFTSGSDYAGQRVLILGSGNSAHDIAQDVYVGGAEAVTMVQRSSTTVVSIEPSQAAYAHYQEGLSTDEADLVSSATTYDHLVRGYRQMTARLKDVDHELNSKLNAVGFRTDWGSDETGHQMKYLRRGGGYYVNVGCSDLIAAGAIDVLDAARVRRIDAAGAVLDDGTRIGADAIICATGYRPQQELVRRLFGAAVADAVGPIWGFDEEGELRNAWRRTAQPGLWFNLGSLSQSRIYSKILALQIAAVEAGVLEPLGRST